MIGKVLPLVSLVGLACLICTVSASPDGTTSVSLTKRPLDLERLAHQRQVYQQRLLATVNGGEDIKLQDFMDAQVKGLHSTYRQVKVCIES